MLISVQRPRGLTSAAGDCGVQTGALCDVDLDHLLGTGRVDTYCLQKVGICCSTSKKNIQTNIEVIQLAFTHTLS